jgi:hypothetical protein
MDWFLCVCVWGGGGEELALEVRPNILNTPRIILIIFSPYNIDIIMIGLSLLRKN